ncbi:transposase [Peptoniphilus asaccharolyticus]|uniref:transposase n=1 Tax=Peptoniphilus asaccharolyticus TaxID=1258 RepID=UPI002285C5FE|nr:transposase [Peptoniphilus asaccharolyticus]
MERLNLTELKKVYSSFGRNPTVNPVTMLEIIIYCYLEAIFTSREIEKSCKYDLRIRYLLDGNMSLINRAKFK